MIDMVVLLEVWAMKIAMGVTVTVDVIVIVVTIEILEIAREMISEIEVAVIEATKDMLPHLKDTGTMIEATIETAIAIEVIPIDKIIVVIRNNTVNEAGVEIANQKKHRRDLLLKKRLRNLQPLRKRNANYW